MMKNKLRNEIHNFILQWNKKFPIDYWWRQKYNIPFGSKLHKDSNFIDMFIDYEEEKLMNNLYRDTSTDEKEMGMTKQEVDDIFDNIDISKYDSKK